MLLDIAANLGECFLFSCAMPRRVGLRSNTGNNLPGLLKDGIAVEIIKIPARGSRLLRKFARLLVEGRKRIAKKYASYALRRPLATTEHPSRHTPETRL